jgi:MscS family membrane protein
MLAERPKRGVSASTCVSHSAVIRRTLVHAWVTLLFSLAVLCLARSASARQLKASSPSNTPPVEHVEEEASDSPRASMRAYLSFSEKGRYQDAAAYLDAPRTSDRTAADLAAKLYAVLSQRLLINPDTLSPLASGRPSDGLPSGIEELGRIPDTTGHPIAIRLVRREPRAADETPRWVFSQATVGAIPTLYASLPDHWVREHFPSSFLKQGPLALYTWQWIALPVLGLACLILGRLLTWISSALAGRALASQTWSSRLRSELKWPVAIGWALVLFAFASDELALTIRANDLVDRVLRALGYLTLFGALLRVVALVGDEVTKTEWATTRPTARALSGVGVRLGKVVVGALALMAALSELGYPITSVIAGLGLGGIALALAAQKTVENLFGSVSIIIDQPFRVGDTIRVDTIEGTVENIGLRSTRVRTAERTLIIFPNGKLADMRIESLGPRDRMRFATKIALSRECAAPQVRRVVSDVQERLGQHRLVRKADVLVALGALGESSLDIEVSAPIETTDANEFARVREELLLTCIECVERAGAALAVPLRKVVDAERTRARAKTTQ